MQIQYCTITGADDQTFTDELAAMSAKYPFVEWGVLVYPKKMGTPRYPNLTWIDDLRTQTLECPMHLSAHLCGDAVDHFLTGNSVYRKLIDPFQRIQLNMAVTPTSVRRIGPTVRNAIRRYAVDKTVITQHNDATTRLYRHLSDLDTHALLFDASRGNGVMPSHWHVPFPATRCGYAGGLSPENIDAALAAIDRVAGTATIWIDMESGVRTNDELDMEKVENILVAASKYA